MSAVYESDKALAEYLLFHFGHNSEILPPEHPWPPGMREALGFPRRTPSHFSPGEVARGLDLGCAVGRSTFEMARTCGEVVGIDFSSAFIEAAETLRRGKPLPYRRLEEASVQTLLTATPPGGVDPSRIHFLQGDAMHLPELGSFDRVHAANLICRLANPSLLLQRLPQLVKPAGELVLATPCTWLEEFTPPDAWPSTGTLHWLKESLEPHFTLIRETGEPFLIRETARKFQWSLSLVTVWKRSLTTASATDASPP